MEVQGLRVLTEVARTGSYTAAAQALGYTQPAVSYQMRRLQQSVGAPLVVRVGRGLRLTEVGQVLVRHANGIFSALRAADQEVAASVAHGGGLVRMVAFQSSCMTLVPRAVERLAAAHPGVRVTVAQAEPVEARRVVRSGEADVGLLCNWENEELPEGEETMLRLELMTDRRFVVMREDHPLAGRPAVGLAELADSNWVMESFRDRFVAACTHLGFVPRVVATVDDALATQALVASGLGVSLVSELGLHAHLLPGLVCRPLSNWPLRRTYLLMWPDMLQVGAVAAAVRVIRACAEQLMAAAPAIGGAVPGEH
ncbi:LysR family transcriptional regulator [Actinacidiphila yeochonensis]|uniref:LysR family transcriptional regulator n=1 Tax=Actinacidiphila yeochonensis TaxID=89050 RepID=UPI0007C6CBFE|nr:LysR family transcriptional regulator [Actinacidiphila yeochonensis]